MVKPDLAHQIKSKHIVAMALELTWLDAKRELTLKAVKVSHASESKANEKLVHLLLIRN